MLASLRKLYRNTLFRLSLLGAILFIVSLIISLGYIYYATVEAELRRVDKMLEAEMIEFQTLLSEEGGANLERAVILRSVAQEGLYLLETPKAVIGNLEFMRVTQESGENSEIPGLEGEDFKRLKLTISLPTKTNVEGEGTSSEPILEDRRARAIAGTLKLNGEAIAVAVVGRDVELIMRTADKVKNAIFTSCLIALALGIVSSLYVSRRFMLRIEEFNQLATDIRAGHLNRRASRTYSEDELDLLAEHLNSMLDHIDRLMKAMRYAGDSIAHDLRSPLTRLRTRLESEAANIDNNQASETLSAAANDAAELLKTFDSVLRIARLEAGERRELLNPINLKPLLDDIAELYEPACEEAGLEFQVDIAKDLSINADRGLLSQAISNLVENAIKYTPPHGQIRLQLKRNRSGRVEISVIDNGPGIPERDRERVKERFVRLDESRTKAGSGLGLTLVGAIADLHRAEFRLEEGLASDFGLGLAARLIFPRQKRFKMPQKADLKSAAE